MSRPLPRTGGRMTNLNPEPIAATWTRDRFSERTNLWIKLLTVNAVLLIANLAVLTWLVIQ